MFPSVPVCCPCMSYLTPSVTQHCQILFCRNACGFWALVSKVCTYTKPEQNSGERQEWRKKNIPKPPCFVSINSVHADCKLNQQSAASKLLFHASCPIYHSSSGTMFVLSTFFRNQTHVFHCSLWCSEEGKVVFPGRECTVRSVRINCSCVYGETERIAQHTVLILPGAACISMRPPVVIRASRILT